MSYIHSTMAKVLVSGMGRMGALIVKQLVDAGHTIVAAVDAKGSESLGKDAGELAQVGSIGVTVSDAANLKSILAETSPKVAVDFSVASACVPNMSACAEAGCHIVVGTTGLSEKDHVSLKKITEVNNVGAVISPNMSLGVNVFWKLCQEAAKVLNDYDIEIIDAHHKFKKDAPSGTALKAAELIAEAAGIKLPEKMVYGRKGESLRSEGEIGIHAIRAGNIVGEHTVMFASPTERLEVRHVAQSREAFAAGVVKAVEFVKAKKGVYTMADVLNL